MITVIEKLDGTRINLFENNIMTLDFVVSPIDLVFDSESIPGRPGRIRTRDDYGNRKVILKLMAMAESRSDISVIRDELASIIDGNEPFYIYESVTTKLYDFEVPGQMNKTAYDHATSVTDFSKRLLIQRTGNESLKFDGLNGKRSIEFETHTLPFWESTTTKTISGSTVTNNGNVPINPRYMPLKVTLSGGSITNITTGEIITYSGSGSLVIDGIKYLSGGSSVTKDTNFGLITLMPGVNQFSTSATFEFKEYYL